jgi:hypothetical protein
MKKSVSSKKAGKLSSAKTIGSPHDLNSDPAWDPSIEIDPETEKLIEEMCEATGLTCGQIVTKALAAYTKAHGPMPGLELVDRFEGDYGKDHGALYLDKSGPLLVEQGKPSKRVTFSAAMKWLSKKHSIDGLNSSPLNYGRFFKLVAEKLPQNV